MGLKTQDKTNWIRKGIDIVSWIFAVEELEVP